MGLIETCEESGSYDLPAYLDALAPRMGDVGLVIALDSGAGNYDQLWATTSLRGLVNGTLRVDILTEGVHSGDAGGVVPSSFRIARALLDRIDDSRTGVVKGARFRVRDSRRAPGAGASRRRTILGESLWKRFPWASCCDDPGTARLFAQPVTKDPVELILNRTWRAALAVTGADGLPPLESAGNVQRPYTSLKLSLRLPPLVDGERAATSLKKLLENDVPYSASRRRSTRDSAATGWNAPSTAPWLAARARPGVATRSSGKPAAYMGEGGTIPFMSMLNVKFPQAQLLVTGVLGPKSNAHGPNEFLDIAYAKKVTAATAMVIAARCRLNRGQTPVSAVAVGRAPAKPGSDPGLAISEPAHRLPDQQALRAIAAERGDDAASPPRSRRPRRSRRCPRLRAIAPTACTIAAHSRLFAQLAHERPVDLHRLHREAAHQAQRRVAGAEVVDRDLHAERLQRAHRCGRSRRTRPSARARESRGARCRPARRASCSACSNTRSAKSVLLQLARPRR